MTASTSLRVMRPPTPVPAMLAGSREFSVIRRRTTGDSTRPERSAAGAAGEASRAKSSTHLGLVLLKNDMTWEFWFGSLSEFIDYDLEYKQIL